MFSERMDDDYSDAEFQGTEADDLSHMSQELQELLLEADKYDSSLSLCVNDEGRCVTLYLDTSIDCYAEHIPGERGDAAFMRCVETNKIVGVRLPLLRNNLTVSHRGPIRINEGFLQGDRQ